MPEYPTEWLAAADRALSAAIVCGASGGRADAPRLILDHLVPLIQQGVLADAAQARRDLIARNPPVPEATIDVRGLGNPDPYRLNQRSFMLATNEGSVPGADMGGNPASDPGIDAVAEFKIDRLLEQLCAEALRRFDRANTEGDPRREPLAQIANVLNAVREARA